MLFDFIFEKRFPCGWAMLSLLTVLALVPRRHSIPRLTL